VEHLSFDPLTTRYPDDGRHPSKPRTARYGRADRGRGRLSRCVRPDARFASIRRGHHRRLGAVGMRAGAGGAGRSRPASSPAETALTSRIRTASPIPGGGVRSAKRPSLRLRASRGARRPDRSPRRSSPRLTGHVAAHAQSGRADVAACSRLGATTAGRRDLRPGRGVAGARPDGRRHVALPALSPSSDDPGPGHRRSGLPRAASAGRRTSGRGLRAGRCRTRPAAARAAASRTEARPPFVTAASATKPVRRPQHDDGGGGATVAMGAPGRPGSPAYCSSRPDRR
jgi:hypothetical protein